MPLTPKLSPKPFWIALAVTVLAGLALVGVGAWYLQKQRSAYYAEVAALRKPDVQITVVEGRRREEIAQQLARAGICSYDDFLAASAGKEGMLFPDTYRFFPATPAANVVATMYDTYLARTADLQPTAAQLVLASIVEREAERDADRATIAGVYQNRLDIGMSLQADPTVQYAKDSNSASASLDYWQPITQSDYRAVQSPYNTYLHVGLPPGPICNPGLRSIEAAMRPARHNYYFIYYKDGQLLLSKTLQEHESKQ